MRAIDPKIDKKWCLDRIEILTEGIERARECRHLIPQIKKHFCRVWPADPKILDEAIEEFFIEEIPVRIPGYGITVRG